MLSIPSRWTVWFDNGDAYIHIQVPGHSNGRPYGTVVNVSGLATETMDSLVPDSATHSFNGSKVYSNCTLVFDGSPVLLLIIGGISLYIPISGEVYKWLLEEQSIKGE